MKSERLFYSSVGLLFLVVMLVGFRAFALHGTGQGGRVIDPAIYALVAVHGMAIAAWFVLFFTQSVLVMVRRGKLHMTLGWAVVAVGLTIAYTGTMVAVRSVQHTPREFVFFGMPYARFLLVMLVEIWTFVAFVTAGVLTRKKPAIHRNMMLLASLCILAGATVRMPFLYPVFGTAGWPGMFGAVFLLGAVLVTVSCWRTRSLDRWFAGGYAVWVLIFIATTRLAFTDAWGTVATAILSP